MLKALFQAPVRFYRAYISSLFPATCRYYPSCSAYMLRALDKHGALKGSLMGLGRICRCHPFIKGGFDPVPDHFTLRRNREEISEAERALLIQAKAEEMSDQEL
ncbi:membrane protein insertion efficiency factor YidD [Aerococcus sp. UMB7834]|uniref:membrane protein insertion efficiency factor YidD n=1 Tax=Aerococcus sp. UMB7834 TaxID=3046342 RepID=UPI00254AF71A|nr:membrane protein insertion efficiency factor YidD [Aerococcus sp. UMB7834]MDK6805938.1 membrane protein insertion efficiency factor YidD [Aerococcus sp. UMB7834]